MEAFLTFRILLWVFHVSNNAALFHSGWSVESLATRRNVNSSEIVEVATAQFVLLQARTGYLNQPDHFAIESAAPNTDPCEMINSDQTKHRGNGILHARVAGQKDLNDQPSLGD
jgi:hypothetical protein